MQVSEKCLGKGTGLCKDKLQMPFQQAASRGMTSLSTIICEQKCVKDLIIRCVTLGKCNTLSSARNRPSYGVSLALSFPRSCIKVNVLAIWWPALAFARSCYHWASYTPIALHESTRCITTVVLKPCCDLAPIIISAAVTCIDNSNERQGIISFSSQAYEQNS